MDNRKKIALLCGQAEENYQSKFISGFLKQAFSEDLDVCIFSMLIKYQNTTAREHGDSNIFSLINYSRFDALVLLSDTIQTPGMLSELEEEIHNKFQGPVLVVDQNSKYFPSIWTDSYTPFAHLVQHLISVHGFSDIAFLNGKKRHPHSIQRFKAYEDTLHKNGISVREDRIFEGDYWYGSGNACAEELLEDREHLPQAIICANDPMAIGLCQALSENGVEIPGQIAVVGFDSIEEGRLSPSPITSAYIPAGSTGKHAAQSICHLLAGKDIRDPETKVDLFIGSSCGCHNTESVMPAVDILRKSWNTELSDDSFFSIHNKMQEDIMLEDTLHGTLEAAYRYIYQIKDYDDLHICLCEQWLTAASLTSGKLLSSGYSEHMLHALRAYGSESVSDRLDIRNSFDMTDMLPELWEEHEKPYAYMFTPLFFEENCFGYSAINYGSRCRAYDEIYRLWMEALMRGLESLRRAAIAKEKDEKHQSTTEYQLSPEELVIMEEVANILSENRMTYYLQPIVRTTDGSIYAYEALMRAKSSMKISPLQIIKYAAKLKRLADVEKATFLNVLNNVEENEHIFEKRHIFINSIPGIKLLPEDEERIEQMLSKHGRQAVIELTEQAEMDDKDLDAMKERYLRIGVGTAIDDYGTGYSNVANLLRYMPNYVKVDRSLLSGIQDSPQKQHFVREIVTFSHDNGIMVLAEGVETGDELRTVIHLGCDLIQGYYTGRPGPGIPDHIDENIAAEIRRYHSEKESGGMRRIYSAGKTARISAAAIVKDGYNKIEAGSGDLTYRDFSLRGTPGQRSDLQLLIRDGYEGQITLEHLHLTSMKHQPCITLEPGAKLTLFLIGENVFTGGGIRVPKGAQLTVRGDGDLTIQLNSADYCGIGCIDEEAGIMEFYQDGGIILDANGTKGIGIGGNGADIQIHSGRYALQQGGESAVGIGCFDADIDLHIDTCELDLTFSAINICGIGSMEGSTDVSIQSAFLRFFGSGKRIMVVGSLGGDHAKVLLKDMATNMDIRSDKSSGTGSLNGESDVTLDNISYRFTGNGDENYAYGGINGIGSIRGINSDVSLRIRNESGKSSLLPEDESSWTDCRRDYILNDAVAPLP